MIFSWNRKAKKLTQILLERGCSHQLAARIVDALEKHGEDYSEEPSLWTVEKAIRRIPGDDDLVAIGSGRDYDSVLVIDPSDGVVYYDTDYERAEVAKSLDELLRSMGCEDFPGNVRPKMTCRLLKGRHGGKNRRRNSMRPSCFEM